MKQQGTKESERLFLTFSKESGNESENPDSGQ